jgi:hypothetical protein
MAKKKWVTIDGADVRHVWACQATDCPHKGEDSTVGPGFYEENGTPVCGSCGDDMKYLRTEIRR